MGGMTKQLSIHHTLVISYERSARTLRYPVLTTVRTRMEQAMANQSELAGRAREAWEKNAAWWDDYIGADGNAFHRELIAPLQLRLLDLRRGERVLDIPCGHRQLARATARPVAE